ncbi:MAG: polysaccharide biosynthesis/export family protein [Pyrinomonadaceae bacterium]
MIESVAYSTPASLHEDRSRPLSIVRENEGNTQRTVTANLSPTSIYRIGVGDVLMIEIQNASTSSGLYTVRNDGTVDFPLAGEYVSVADKTTDEIEGQLSESISLYSTPQVSVKIAEYVSHGVLVSGLVEMPGFHQIHRDAVPLYVIRSAAGVTQSAKRVTIKRERALGTESYLLSSPNTDRTLIFPGDSVEFSGNL